jgi:predicted ArsR family transcriptional regulator
MGSGDWRDRLLASTRGRVVALLRRSAQTANELAAQLELTSNAVRLHLSALERDGLVEQHGTRREWTGKPAFVYRTTPEAEALYPKPYGLVLGELLAALESKLTPAEQERLAREIGVRLARSHGPAAGGSPAARSAAEAAARAAAVLNELGGLTEVQEDEAGLRVQGYSCPLGELTAAHPILCRLAEALVSELAGAPVTECCDRGERPRCAFRVLRGSA